MATEREIAAVVAISIAIEELSQIGTLRNLRAWPVSAHARVSVALTELRRAQAGYQIEDEE